jgi:cytochrome c oxidase cbb3-type subunit I/II
MSIEKFNYDNRIVKNFAIATMVWGLVGMLVGLIAALQLTSAGFDAQPYLNFGRIRPLHTNAVIFAFVGNAMFMGIYYSLQRLLKARMFSDTLSKLHFWGWQLIIVAAALTLPLGITTSKEYAELEWPIDILIAIVWVIFGWNMFGTIIKRRERHLYVAVWFYIATVVTVAVLHIVNSLAIPVNFFKSYSIFAGVQDALVQWWYGHNAVAFFLTTPYLGLMYYYLPKAANRPVYSYRLSIIHFWALIFLYIWAGPHHLLYTSLPDWAQSLGTVFSIMLIAPSWGGMINGLLTLRGAWDRVRDDVVLKFFVVAVTAYGMSTFEGPMLSLKNVNAISHFSDWTIGHVHIGGMGWNGMLTFGVLYWLIPKIYGAKLFSRKLANFHFWIATLGILVYVIPVYFAGFTQYFMLREFTPDGVLRYPNFLDTVVQVIPMYQLRALGGALFLVGAIVMVYNLAKTAASGKLVAEEPAEAPALEKHYVAHKGHWHRWIERRPVQFILLSLIMILIGGMAEIIPMLSIKSNVPTIASVHPYTPLELQGRDIYVREGCYVCHSQMIRPFRAETERYGEYSKAGEFVYDHPFQWGSKRTGPDLAREGQLNPSAAWHYRHMMDPTLTSPRSIMPRYEFLTTNDLDTSTTAAKIAAMKTLGVPYPDGYEQVANADLVKQEALIAQELKDAKIPSEGNKEIIALIAYLKRLGTDIRAEHTATR